MSCPAHSEAYEPHASDYEPGYVPPLRYTANDAVHQMSNAFLELYNQLAAENAALKARAEEADEHRRRAEALSSIIAAFLHEPCDDACGETGYCAACVGVLEDRFYAEIGDTE